METILTIIFALIVFSLLLTGLLTVFFLLAITYVVIAYVLHKWLKINKPWEHLEDQYNDFTAGFEVGDDFGG